MAKKNKVVPVFKVINWDCNRSNVEYYDIMPILIREWEDEKKRKNKIWNIRWENDVTVTMSNKMPETQEEFKKFVEYAARPYFWSKSEAECVVSSWPPKTPKLDKETYEKDEVEHMFNHYPYGKKIDIYQQIEANMDVIVKLLMEYFEK